WQVPAYTFPENLTNMAVMRIVIRNGFSMDLANLLLDDIRMHLRVLEHHPQTQPPPELQHKRESFAHYRGAEADLRSPLREVAKFPTSRTINKFSQEPPHSAHILVRQLFDERLQEDVILLHD